MTAQSRSGRKTALAYPERLDLLHLMLGWSLKLGRIRGIQLAVHVSFFLLLGFNAWSGWDDGGWSGLLWDSAALLAFFGCVVLHELGHSFTAMHYGIGVRRILLMPIGGMAEFDGIPREPVRELLITLAGPAVNFVIAGVLWVVIPSAQGQAQEGSVAEFGLLLLNWNLLMGTFNLLPAFPMDGGRILRALLATRLPYLRATFWAASVGKVLCVAGAIAGAYFQAPMVILLFGFIFFAGEMEYRAAVRREIEDAHWRAVLARLQVPEETVDEPPLLGR